MRTLVMLLLFVAVTPWSWPIDAREIARAFTAPTTPYGPGHRGIDVAAPAGLPVVAPADGVVRFAGMVAGRPVLSIDHGGGLVSSFEPVVASVSQGDHVARGTEVGVLLDGHVAGESRLHLGARQHGDYVDPLLLLGVERPVLLPQGQPLRSTGARRPGRVRLADARCGTRRSAAQARRACRSASCQGSSARASPAPP